MVPIFFMMQNSPLWPWSQRGGLALLHWTINRTFLCSRGRHELCCSLLPTAVSCKINKSVNQPANPWDEHRGQRQSLLFLLRDVHRHDRGPWASVAWPGSWESVYRVNYLPVLNRKWLRKNKTRLTLVAGRTMLDSRMREDGLPWYSCNLIFTDVYNCLRE